MAESEKDTEHGFQSYSKRNTRQIWPYLLHILIFTLYSVAFLTATSFWQSQDYHRTFAYCESRLQNDTYSRRTS